MDWKAIEREAVDVLSEYLRIDTTNPPGNERQAIEFLSRFLKNEGFAVEIFAADPERPNLLCRLDSGQDPRGLILLHHCDVVGADPREWAVPPFGGVVRDGYIYGRGALDMKGMGVMELLAFVLAKREKLPLRKDLVLVVCCDEETGSRYGAEFLAKNHPRELEAAWVLNEGGSGWNMGDREVVLLGFGEKGLLWLRLGAEGKAGHGSMPHGQNPCEKLLEGLSALKAAPRPLRVLPEMQALLRNLGLTDLKPEELEAHPLLKIPLLRAMFQDTLSVTMLQAGFKPNVIPTRAEAVLDVRVLPGRSIADLIAEIRENLPPGPFSLEVIQSFPPSLSPVENEFFECLKQTAEKFFPRALFLPCVFPGFTDSRCFRELGTIGYGWIPAMIDPEDVTRVHGVDERIKVSDLGTGIQVVWEIVQRMVGKDQR
ncbi:MAG: M20/M25/M40 family metallo-hydrolase [Deltaproteobacteria bacterium]|nr:M20/M25/M40 family metallo-hydrolase [Deltaproteobacteria bacterium]